MSTTEEQGTEIPIPLHAGSVSYRCLKFEFLEL